MFVDIELKHKARFLQVAIRQLPMYKLHLHVLKFI